MKKDKDRYHHGQLREALLDAVNDMATQFGIEAVSLRACARHLGVAPSSAFRHYTDKRCLMTAFAVRALNSLCAAIESARCQADAQNERPFRAVCLAYVTFAVEQPALFRGMWREDTLYASDDAYQTAMHRLSSFMKQGFAHTLVDDDPENLSVSEQLAWSTVHGLACLFVDGPESHAPRSQRLARAEEVLAALEPVLGSSHGAVQGEQDP